MGSVVRRWSSEPSDPAVTSSFRSGQRADLTGQCLEIVLRNAHLFHDVVKRLTPSSRAHLEAGASPWSYPGLRFW